MKYDVYRRSYWENDEERNAAEEWEYAGTTWAVSADKAINNVRWRLFGNKSQYLPQVVNGKDAFGWEWKAEEMPIEMTEEMNTSTETIKANSPEAIMAKYEENMGIAKKDKKERYLLKDKIVCAFLYFLYETRDEKGKAHHRFTQGDLAVIFGWPADAIAGAVTDKTILGIAKIMTEFTKQFEEYFECSKIGKIMEANILKKVSAWRKAFKMEEEK